MLSIGGKMNKISCDCNIIHKEAVYNTKKMLEEIKYLMMYLIF